MIEKAETVTEEQTTLLSRRGFLTGAAIVGAGVAASTLAGCASDGAATEGDGTDTNANTTSAIPTSWDNEADVVIVGAGIVGLVAAIRAKDLGATVICVEANYACGGHALTSGGHMHLGGGHSLQQRMGVEDSADMYYLDHTAPFDERNAANIREVVRGQADYHAESFEFLLENGWVHLADETLRIQNDGDTVARSVTSDRSDWADTDPIAGGEARGPAGLGLTRPLEVSARDKGVEFYMNHHMDKLYRDDSGIVVGLEASYSPRLIGGSTTPLVDLDQFQAGNIESTETIRIKARKGIVIATGGSTSNWQFHSLLDPRYGPEHANGVGGDPFSFQDASGEIACIEIGAVLGGTEVGTNPAKARAIGTQYGYRRATIGEGSGVWPLVRSYGFDVDSDRTKEEGIIYVNMLGQRFWAENDWGNDYWEAALGSAVVEENGKAKRLAGPIWAIFDEDWRAQMEWDCDGLPSVDRENGYFYSADSLAELADQIVNKFYEEHPMPAENLEATVARYNGFVDSGVDEDFARENPQYKIQTPPFYAAWCPNAFHDTLVGVLINERFQVMDVRREVIPHLYCGGEASAGQGMHGHGKNVSNGYAIGTHIVEETAI